jgi:tetratricopeptide (TPR) repeat protein
VLQAVSELDESILQRELGRLVHAELVYQRGVAPSATYIFKHALLQDIAYESLLRSTRQGYHRRIAEVLQERFPQTAETQPELLAHHYTEAGLAGKAITYGVRAAQRATNRSANREVVEHVDKGLALLATLPPGLEPDRHELDLQFTLGVAYRNLKGFNDLETKRAFIRAQELCERVGGESTKLISILRGMFTCYFVDGDQRGSQEVAERLRTLANQTQDTDHLVQVYTSFGGNLFYRGRGLDHRIGHFQPYRRRARFLKRRTMRPSWRSSVAQQVIEGGRRHDRGRGRLLESRRLCEQALSLYDTTQSYEQTTYVLNPRTASLNNLSWVLWTLGYPDQAIRTGDEAITFSRNLQQPFSFAVALAWVGSMRTCCGHIVAIEPLIQELRDVVRQNNIAHWRDRAVFLQGKLLSAKGQVETGLGLMREALGATRTADARLAWTWMASETVAEYLSIGEIEAGFTLLTEAFELVARNNESNWEAELYRLKAIPSPKMLR